MIELTRLNLLGQQCRIARTYGASVLGFTLMRRYEEAMGCHDKLTDDILARARARGLHGFMPTGDNRCSASWHLRQQLTHSDRLRLERWARQERGERFDAFMRRQAA